jgi:type 1 glutamine amidotransferase
MRSIRIAIWMLVLLPLLPQGGLSAEGYSHESPVPAEHLEKIEAAAPSKARAAPRRPRRLLVYSYAESFHSSVPYLARALEAMGRKTGAFEAVFTSDTSAFEPENLERFEAVFLNNITPIGKLPKELFLPDCGVGFAKLPPAEQEAARRRNERLKKSLLDFVRGGKGLCGNHSTTDCFYEWREFGEMIGGYFDGHPWHGKVKVELVDPAHPVNAAFGGKSFEVVDEIYQFKETYSRDKLRVLTRLDPKGLAGGSRPDRDFAVSWVRAWGKGRVFYSSLGHREEISWNPMVLEHFLDGIQFALGDLDADTRPSAELAGRPSSRPGAD